MRFDTPQKFGSYELLEIIGRGGMAEIFRAVDVRNDRELVVKKMLPEIAQDDNNVWMFLDEARTQSSFTHPNIVQIFDWGEIEGSYFISMEWVRGRDLARVKNRAKNLNVKVSEDIICYVVLNVLNALDYIHSATDEEGNNLHLVHRDINPANIFMSWEGDVKIGDFGIAKTSHLPTVTAEGAFRGTLGYMSPEQIRAEPLDSRSDLYALGCVFYELLTWQTPFAGGSDVDVLKRTISSKVIAPSKHNDRIKPELENIILKALNPKRNRRYTTARAFSEDLLEYLYRQGKDMGRRDIQRVLYKLFRGEIESEREFDVHLAKIRGAKEVAAQSGYLLKGPGGANLGPFDKTTVEALIQAGKLLPDEEVSESGDRFRAASEVTSLRSLFRDAMADKQRLMQASFFSNPGEKPFPYTTAIVVEDDEETGDRIKNVLENNLFRVQSKDDIKDLLLMAAKEPPAVIISSIVMRKLNGYQLLQRLAENPVTASVPIVFLTAREEMRRTLKGFRFGAVDFITKPFSDNYLLEQINAILERLVFREGNFFGSFENAALEKINRTLLYEAKTGFLSIDAEGERGQIVYKHGRPAFPYMGKTEGEEAYTEVSGFKRGDFRFFEIDPFRTEFVVSEGAFLPLEKKEEEEEGGKAFAPEPPISLKELKPENRKIGILCEEAADAEKLSEYWRSKGINPTVYTISAEDQTRLMEANHLVVFAIVERPRSKVWEGAWKIRAKRYRNETPLIFIMGEKRELQDAKISADLAKKALERLLMLSAPQIAFEQKLLSESLKPIYGRLEYIGLNNIIRMLSEREQTGILNVRCFWGEGLIAWNEGRIYNAHLKTHESIDGSSAIIEMLDWYMADYCYLPVARHEKSNMEVHKIESMLERLGKAVDERIARAQISCVAAAKSIEINPERPQGILQKPPPLISKLLKAIESGATPSEIFGGAGATQIETLNALAALAARHYIILR